MKCTIVWTKNFAIPHDAVNSDIEGLDEDSLDEQSEEFSLEAANIDIVFVDQDDINVNLVAVAIVENTGRGRPSNVSVDDFEWSCESGMFRLLAFLKRLDKLKLCPTTVLLLTFSSCLLSTIF